jgi:hypothetical protein
VVKWRELAAAVVIASVLFGTAALIAAAVPAPGRPAAAART